MSGKLQLSIKQVNEQLPAAALTSRQQLDQWTQEVFSHCQHQDYCCWLDSAALEHRDSRFHLLVKQPHYVLQTAGQGCTIDALSNRLGRTINTDALQQQPMLTAMRQLMTELNEHIDAPTEHSELPFHGGFLGLLGYDLGRQLEQLPEINADDYLTPDAVIGFYTEALIVDLQELTVWVLAPEQQHLDYLQQWLNEPPHAHAPIRLTSGWESNMTRQDYGQRFQRVHQYLLAGDCYQINLAQRFSAHYSGSEWSAYVRLRQQNGAPFSAFIRLPHSTILSVSPERFLAVDAHGHVQTKPIKGTRPRYPDPEHDAASRTQLQHSEKDRAENLMIVDLLRNDLSRSCQPGSVKVPALFAIESFPAVHHLVSTVVGQLEPQKNAIDLFTAAFPGGSITGAPKVRAMQIIEELEPHRRAAYCGSIAYFSLTGNSDSSITIRTLLAEQDTLYCWAGGGLVADSVEADEYQETLDKVARILPVLEQS